MNGPKIYYDKFQLPNSFTHVCITLMCLSVFHSLLVNDGQEYLVIVSYYIGSSVYSRAAFIVYVRATVITVLIQFSRYYMFFAI